MAHAPALSHGDQLHGVDRSEVLAGVMVDQTARVQRQTRPQKTLAALVGADEADILAVGLVRRPQTQPVGLVPHLGLGHLAHREE